MFGSDGPTTDDPGLRGTWTGAAATLRFDENGRYALLVHGTAAGAGLECGRWRALDGDLQMRVERGANSIDLATMREPGLRLGHLARRDDVLAFEVKDVSGTWIRHSFTRAQGSNPSLNCGE